MGRIVKLLIVFVVLFLFAPKASADIVCQPIYGGGQTCITVGNVVVNKTVLNPKTNKLVDNLSINDPKYEPGFITTFQITIANSGNTTISHIDVKDIFPQYLIFSAGPGSFDANTKTLSFGLDNLKPNEVKTFTILGRVVEANQLPIAQGVVCVVNQAVATSDNNATSQDNSQLCIEKKAPKAVTKAGLPVSPPSQIKITPATGPGDFQLIGLAAIGIIGYFLRKKN